jgi:NAD(P)-dependent dehydrogenase (short-subunit alcohol dehydrogenase family)
VLLTGKVAVVTGAGQGIGRAYAFALAGAGAKVVVAEINTGNGEAVADELTAAGHHALFVETDVASQDSTVEMARRAGEEFGGIDVLVNNAAIYFGLPYESLEEIDEDRWDRVMAVNIKGVWMSSRAVLPHMRARGGGSIVNQSSTAAYHCVPRRMNYNVSKAAVIAITKTLAKELAPDHIRVNAIAPGAIYTEATKQGVPAEVLDNLAKSLLIKDFGAETDVNGTLLFLASDMSASLTGQVIVADGGALMRG